MAINSRLHLIPECTDIPRSGIEFIPIWGPSQGWIRGRDIRANATNFKIQNFQKSWIQTRNIKAPTISDSTTCGSFNSMNRGYCILRPFSTFRTHVVQHQEVELFRSDHTPTSPKLGLSASYPVLYLELGTRLS